MVDINYSDVMQEKRWFLKKGYKLSFAKLRESLQEECFGRIPDPFCYLWHTWTQDKGRLVNKLSLRGKYFEFQYGLADILRPLGARVVEIPNAGSEPFVHKGTPISGFVNLKRDESVDLERLERLYESLLRSAAYLHVFLRWVCQQALDGKNIEESIALLPDGQQKENLESFTAFRAQFLESFFVCADIQSLEEHLAYLDKRAKSDLLVSTQKVADVAKPYLKILTNYKKSIFQDQEFVTPRAVEWVLSWDKPMAFWDAVDKQRKEDEKQMKTAFREYIGPAFRAIPWEFTPGNNSIVSSLPLSIFSEMKTPF